MTGHADALIISVPIIFSDFPVMNRYSLDATEKGKYWEFVLTITEGKVYQRQLYQAGNAKEQNRRKKRAGDTEQMKTQLWLRGKAIKRGSSRCKGIQDLPAKGSIWTVGSVLVPETRRGMKRKRKGRVI